MINNWCVITDNPKKKTSELIKECRALFPVYFYDEEHADKYFPAPKKKTTRTFEPNIEADEKHKNKSYDDLEKEGIEGITLRERLIMEIQYFKETGNHLDIENITLCSGSLCEGWSGQGVPDVDWSGSELCVGWYRRGGASGGLRSRQVVSGTLVPSHSNTSKTPSEITIDGKVYTLTLKR